MEISTDKIGATSAKLTKVPSRDRKVTEKSPRAKEEKERSSRHLKQSEKDLAVLFKQQDKMTLYVTGIKGW